MVQVWGQMNNLKIHEEVDELKSVGTPQQINAGPISSRPYFI